MASITWWSRARGEGALAYAADGRKMSLPISGGKLWRDGEALCDGRGEPMRYAEMTQADEQVVDYSGDENAAVELTWDDDPRLAWITYTDSGYRTGLTGSPIPRLMLMVGPSVFAAEGFATDPAIATAAERHELMVRRGLGAVRDVLPPRSALGQPSMDDEAAVQVIRNHVCGGVST